MAPHRSLRGPRSTMAGAARVHWAARWSAAGLALAAGLCALVGLVAGASAQVKNPLFDHTRDPAMISQQVQLALPSALRGLELLTSGGGDAVPLARAMDSIEDTYKYLRAAQESSRLINTQSKYPDPLLPVRADRMWQVRLQLLECLKERGHIVQQNPDAISMCTKRLTEGIRQLRVLLAIMP